MATVDMGEGMEGMEATEEDMGNYNYSINDEQLLIQFLLLLGATVSFND